jgi:hypothetical protein
MFERKQYAGKFDGLVAGQALEVVNRPGSFRLTGVLINFVADATVSDRNLSLRLVDGGEEVLSEVRLPAALVITASQTKIIQMSIGAPEASAWNGDYALTLLPDQFHIPGGRFIEVYDLEIASASDAYDLSLVYEANGKVAFEEFTYS